MPTPAELAPYWPYGLPAAKGTIACQTRENHHVRTCRVVDESPRGSGITKGMLRASKLFRVLPPVVDGHPDFDIWVIITLDNLSKRAP
jgi:protein TonB